MKEIPPAVVAARASGRWRLCLFLNHFPSIRIETGSKYLFNPTFLSITLACSVTGSPTPTVAWYSSFFSHTFHIQILPAFLIYWSFQKFMVYETSLKTQIPRYRNGKRLAGTQASPGGLGETWARLHLACLSEVHILPLRGACFASQRCIFQR